MGVLLIPNSCALRNFDSLFKNNEFDFSDGACSIKFHPRYIAMHPVALAFYAGLADYFKDKNVNVAASLNFKIRSIPYLQRMGLFRVLGFSNPVKTEEHEETGRSHISSYKERRHSNCFGFFRCGFINTIICSCSD